MENCQGAGVYIPDNEVERRMPRFDDIKFFKNQQERMQRFKYAKLSLREVRRMNERSIRMMSEERAQEEKETSTVTINFKTNVIKITTVSTTTIVTVETGAISTISLYVETTTVGVSSTEGVEEAEVVEVVKVDVVAKAG